MQRSANCQPASYKRHSFGARLSDRGPRAAFGASAVPSRTLAMGTGHGGAGATLRGAPSRRPPHRWRGVLEDRARAPTYRAMFRYLIDVMAPPTEGRILDVGCGSGALDRLLAARLGTAARIDAIDINPFLLREAAELAREFGDRIR